MEGNIIAQINSDYKPEYELNYHKLQQAIIEAYKDNILNNMKPIFPEIEVTGREFGKLTITTYIRKQHPDGKWWLMKLRKQFVRLGSDPMTTEKCYVWFYNEVYKYLTLGIIQSDLKDSDGEDIFILDENQEDERVRLANLVVKGHI